jgi:hypothetical protein
MAGAKVRLPTRGPTPDQIADRERWEAMTSASLSSVQAAAERWRTGLAAFVTLITGGLLIKGPQAASDLTTGWRIVITLLAGAGLALAVVGLWLALRAAAGAPGSVSYPDIVRRFGGVRQFEVACARRASDTLRWAKVTMACSLSLLALAIFAWWWAPARRAPAPRLQISVGGSTVCGKLLSADGQQFRVQVDGEAGPRTIPFNRVENVRVGPSC